MNAPNIDIGNSPEKPVIPENETERAEEQKPSQNEPAISPKPEMPVPPAKAVTLAPPPKSDNLSEQPTASSEPAETPKQARAELKKLYGSNDMDPADLTEQISDLQAKT